MTNISITAPSFLYGTAWKEDRTEGLVLEALNAGFVAIDTANQRKHYFEEAVGMGVQSFLKSSGKSRSDLFLQTKFTYQRGQDHRLPYDATASFADQVAQSFQSSLEHLQTDYIDSYVLHGPYQGDGLSEPDFETWKSMENLVDQQKVKSLGVSNVNLMQLRELYTSAKIKPSFVQNRCYARTGWDKKVREFCLANQIKYQGFSLLTANVREVSDPSIIQLAQQYKKTVPQLIFKFAQQIGMLPLTGTSNPAHMKQDLSIAAFLIQPDEIYHIENLSF